MIDLRASLEILPYDALKLAQPLFERMSDELLQSWSLALDRVTRARPNAPTIDKRD